VFLLGFGKSRRGFLGKSLIHLLYFVFLFFPKDFLCDLISIPLIFSTLEQKSTISSIGSLCGKRDCFVVVV